VCVCLSFLVRVLGRPFLFWIVAACCCFLLHRKKSDPEQKMASVQSRLTEYSRSWHFVSLVVRSSRLFGVSIQRHSTGLAGLAVESSRVESSRVESSRVESSRVESSRVESSRVESSRVESNTKQKLRTTVLGTIVFATRK
jgi:hypothetical protein